MFSTWELLRDAFIRGTLASTNINPFPAKQACIYRPGTWSEHWYPNRVSLLDNFQDVGIVMITGRPPKEFGIASSRTISEDCGFKLVSCPSPPL